MDKTPRTFKELESNIGTIIREKYMETLDQELSPDYRKALEEWMDTEIRHLLVATESISKIDLRTKSVVLLFGKKFEKIKELVRILEDYELSGNKELFSRILRLFLL